MAQQALKKAEEAYDDSLDIFSTAESIVLPSINVDTMKEDAQDIKEEVNTTLWINEFFLQGINGGMLTNTSHVSRDGFFRSLCLSTLRQYSGYCWELSDNKALGISRLIK